MKADKVTVTIKMESLSIDVLRGMLEQVIDNVDHGAQSGKIAMDDGDVIEWETVRTRVEF